MIKVYLQRGFDDTGKGKFLQRLANESIKIGVEYTEKPNKCDAILDLAWWHGNKKGIPRILRIDGASVKNSGLIKDAAKKADAVIWQSSFCKKYLGKHYDIKANKDYVIHNGADPLQYQRQTPIGCEVLLSGNWSKDKNNRESKRLKEMLSIASICVEKEKNIRFFIAGETNLDVPKHDRIIAFGGLNDMALSKLISSSSMMLNMSFCDWCPNAVIECLVAGVPVMCSNDGGGIPEIVKDSGWILHLNNTPKPCETPPSIDVNFVADQLLSHVGQSPIVYRSDLYISEIALQYKNAILEVLK